MAKRKRSNGEGSVRRLKSGTWRGQLMDGYKSDGRKNIVSFTGSTKGEVLDQMREYRNKQERMDVSASRVLTFNDWSDTWYKDMESQVQPSTYSSYRYTLTKLQEHFRGKLLTDIKVVQINRYFDSLRRQGLSQSYITKLKAMLIQIFDYALANELVLSNPARASKSVKLLRTAKTAAETAAPKKDAFTEKEQALLMEGLPHNLVGNSIRVLLGSGMRAQELLALTPEDIAEDSSRIHVTKAIEMVDGQPVLGPTKSARGERVIPIADDYRPYVRYLREQGGRIYIWMSLKRDSFLYDVGAFRRRYYNALKQVPGVRRLSPHCCRHTFISNLEREGVPMEQIARIVGHSKIETTDGYLHVNNETLAEAVKVLNHNKDEEKEG